MGTRWRRFRYGTKDTNPIWSFYTTILLIGLILIICGYSETSGNLSAWAYSFVFGILALVSLAHLNMTVCNEKKCAVPIWILDEKRPDLFLALLLGTLLLTKDKIWLNYCREVGDAFYILSRIGYGSVAAGICSLLFLIIPPVALFVFLLMSVTRHLTDKKLTQSLFFVRLIRRVRREGKKQAKRWQEYQEQSAGRGEAVRRWSRRRRAAIFFQTAVMLAGIIYVGAVYWVEDEIMPLGLLTVIFFLYQLLTEMHTAGELGTIIDEIHQMSEDVFVQGEPKLKPNSLFRRSEEELFAIQKNRKESLEKQLQSERMKVDLITNVSHDLKTPLTSMIGCIDLLKKTEGLTGEAGDYVCLLSKKAEKLREMIQDVFEIAKATSGGQNIEMERLDMSRLIRQTMADMQDRIDASGLMFRVKIEDEELPFMGDGKKLYRVYQNLIENTLKYSMAGSRVYISAQEKEGRIITSIKNTSACEMDFCEEEILERFTRGDKSRSTEGNGLGLAIAKSFTEGCRGSFELTLDGDLFKVETSFASLCSPEI